MTLYVLLTKQQAAENPCDTSFATACEHRGIEYKRIITDDLRLNDIATMQFDDNSLLYRMGTGPKARTIQSLLTTLHPNTFTTVQKANVPSLGDQPLSETAAQLAAGLPIIPTCIVDNTWPSMTDAELGEQVEAIGGYPVVLKTLGLSHGQGVSLVETADQLRDKLRNADFKVYNTILRKYLAEYRHYRLIVVDDEVIAIIEYHKPADDFRTNAAEPVVTKVDLNDVSDNTKRMAIESVRLRGSIFGGVDVLADTLEDTDYLAEVNIPCYFARAEKPTGVDIAGALIDALIRNQAA